MNKLILVSIVAATVSSALGDAQYKGPDGGDISDPANWTGGNPFYDATTNKSPAAACFANYSPSPGQAYRVTTSRDVQFGRTYCSATVTFDLYPYTMTCYGGDPLYMPGGTRKYIFASGTVNTGSFTMQQNAKNSELIFTGPQTVGKGGWTIREAFNSKIVVTNGALMAGALYINGYSNNTIHVTGEGTEYRSTKVQVDGHGSSGTWRDGFNQFIIENGAIATNITSISIDGNGRVDDGLIRLSGVVATNNVGLYIGAGGARNRVELTNSVVHLAGEPYVGKNGSANVFDIGKDARVTFRSPNNYFWLGNMAAARDCGMRIHDGGSFTNLGSKDMFIGYQGQRCYADIFAGGQFKSAAQVNVGGSGQSNFFRVRGEGSKATVGTCLVGAEKALNLNHALIVEDGGEFSASTSVKCAGFHNSIVVSNATLRPAYLACFQNSGWGGSNTLVVAGAKAKIETTSDISWSQYSSTVCFAVPQGGYDATPIQANRAFFSRAEFVLDEGLLKEGGSNTLVTVASTASGALSVGNLAAAQAKLIEDYGEKAKCKLWIADDKKSLILTVRPKRGLSVIVK